MLLIKQQQQQKKQLLKKIHHVAIAVFFLNKRDFFFLILLCLAKWFTYWPEGEVNGRRSHVFISGPAGQCWRGRRRECSVFRQAGQDPKQPPAGEASFGQWFRLESSQTCIHSSLLVKKKKKKRKCRGLVCWNFLFFSPAQRVQESSEEEEGGGSRGRGGPRRREHAYGASSRPGQLTRWLCLWTWMSIMSK